MAGAMRSFMRDQALGARVGRSMFWTVTGLFGAQGMRLASNLVLTRLLFPEAFGIMALITAMMIGLKMFSDIGIAPSIQQHPRADEPGFLDTAWSIQVMRGIVLWLGACALAVPVAQFYGAAELAQMLPVAALSMVIAGFLPTRFESASRHLRIGRATLISLGAQALGLTVTILLALAFRSVWALVAGQVLAEAIRVGALHALLPGHVNRFRWDRTAARDLIGFGKWIFLSTLCGFVVAQGDRLILGHYLTLEMLGIFSIGYFIASFPHMLGATAMQRLMIPIYRERPPRAGPKNFRAIRRLRFAISGGLLSLVTVLALSGPWLVDVLYDPRYATAGPVVVLMSCVVILQIVALTYDRAALAAGDSRGFFWLQACRAGIQTTLFLVGAEFAGLGGALVGHAVSVIAIYGLQVRLARRHGAWDWTHDAVIATLGVALGGFAVWMHLDVLSVLWGMSG